MATAKPEQIAILIEGARLVKGHPITMQQKLKDDVPVFKDAPTNLVPSMQTFFAIAVPKIAGQDWKDSVWGQQIVAKAALDYPGGDYNIATFAWKVDDGDCTVPNQNGNIISEYEGYPGNWIIRCTTGFAISSFNVGAYSPTDQIVDANAIKNGDYCNVVLQVGGNFAQSRGMYLNPHIFVLTRAGEAIASGTSGPSAAAFFGGAGAAPAPLATPAATAAAPVIAPPAVTTAPPVAIVVPPAAAPIAPAPDFLNNAAGMAPPPAAPAESYNVNGETCTKEQLLAGGWNEAQIAVLPKA